MNDCLKNKCGENFNTQIAYFKNKKNCSIKNYLNNIKLQQRVQIGRYELKCENGHPLIPVDLRKKDQKSHFRHKNEGDISGNYMTEWHSEWERNFENQEIILPKLKDCIKGRRADATVGNYSLEFQHSRISENEVKERKQDHGLHGNEIIWIIDCTDSINVEKLHLSGNFLIEFKLKKYTWQFKHFNCHKYIYLNQGDKIYRICPEEVKSSMIDVLDFVTKKDFINAIKNNTLESIWNNTKLEVCKLYWKQRGAGCGKTFESIESIDYPIFSDKYQRTYLTKMHSAKEVIINEFKNQQKNLNISDIKISKSWSKKHYKIDYFNNTIAKKCTILIGTIDSFMFAISDKKNKKDDKDFFVALTKSISEGNTSIDINGDIKYAGNLISINKRNLIIIDETQDLPPTYLHALCTIMRDTLVDICLIGDKLQSIFGSDNVFTYLENNELPHINVIKDKSKNEVRRFHNKNFIPFCNKLVPFQKFDLPKIEGICPNDETCKYEHEDDKQPYDIFEIPPIYALDTDEPKVSKLVDVILKKMETCVLRYGYLPYHFMFIFPILEKNYLARRLETAIHFFWLSVLKESTDIKYINYRNKYVFKDEYWFKNLKKDIFPKYVVFHKSSEGKSIDLTESEYATRILSIHASKGNGREVVFLLGISEHALKIFSHKVKNLQYESLHNVSITRQKKLLYVGLVNDDGEIWKRYNNKCNITLDTNIKPKIQDIKCKYKLSDVVRYVLDNDFDNFNEKCIKSYGYEDLIPENRKSKKIIDLGHHIIRYYMTIYYLLYYIINEEQVESSKNDDCEELKESLLDISKRDIKSYDRKEYYKKLEEIVKFSKNHQWNAIEEIPILKFNSSNYSIYAKYESILINMMKNIQKKIKDSGKKLPYLCPLEIIILFYMLLTKKNGKFSEISIMNLYTLLSNFDECSNFINEEHNKIGCLCKLELSGSGSNSESENLKEIRNSIIKHYERVNLTEKLYKNIKKNFPTGFKYNIFHPVVYNGRGEDFKIWENFKIIAHSENRVIIFNIHPQFNSMNFYDIITNSILQTFLLKNTKEEQKNYKRYNEKLITTCIITLDSEKPIVYNFLINESDFYKQLIKKFIINMCEKHHEKIYEYFKWCNNNKVGNLMDYICKQISIDTKKYNLPQYIQNCIIQISKQPSCICIQIITKKDSVLEKLKNELEYWVNQYVGLSDNTIDVDNDVIMFE